MTDRIKSPYLSDVHQDITIVLRASKPPVETGMEIIDENIYKHTQHGDLNLHRGVVAFFDGYRVSQCIKFVSCRILIFSWVWCEGPGQILYGREARG